MMRNVQSIIVSVLIATTYMATTQSAQNDNKPDVYISGIKLGDSASWAKTVLQKQCADLIDKDMEHISFPLAKKSERHLVCQRLNNGGQIAVTLADNAVVHVFSKNIPDSDISSQSAQFQQQHSLGYKVYGDDYQLWKKEADKLAILVNSDAIHPNLFVWESQYLGHQETMPKPVPNDGGYPSILKFGRTFTELEADFEKNCHPLQIMESDVWLLNKPEKQTQVNCFNYQYLGFPRKIEAVFGDDILQLAWILTAKPEESRVRQLLIASFGNPVEENETWISFDQGQVFLRKDKPEVLIISKLLVPFKDKNF